MCREGAWDELAVGVTSGIAIRSGMLVKKSCRTDNDCLLYTTFFVLIMDKMQFAVVLVVKGVKGDMSVLTKAQMEAVYRRNCDMVYRICLMHLKHEQDALDAVSETFLRLFRKKPDFADLEHEKAWLIRTAINYCKDVQKSFWKRKRNIYDETTEQMLQSMQVSEENTELLQAVWRLPPIYAELLYLHYYEEYSIEEIAGIMQKNASTLRSRLGRAKELLRKELEKNE